MNCKNLINSSMAVLGTGITYLIGGWDASMKILAIFIIADYITGVMKSAKNKKIDSSVGFSGLLKKAAIFIVIIIAHQLDMVVSGGSPIFRTMAAYFYIANEGISIMENISLLGVDLPPFLVDALQKVKNDNGATH